MLRKRTLGKVLSYFNSNSLANRGDSLGQPKRSLRVAIAIRYNYYIQLVAIRRDWIRVLNVKF